MSVVGRLPPSSPSPSSSVPSRPFVHRRYGGPEGCAAFSRAVAWLSLMFSPGLCCSVTMLSFPLRGLIDGKEVAGMSVYTVLIIAMQLKVRRVFGLFPCCVP